MNILAAMEKRPGSRISLDSITVSIIIKRISNFHQLSLIVIWYDVHYVITLPLHRYICDDIRLVFMRPGGRGDGDPDFWSNLDITLLAHSLSRTSQPDQEGVTHSSTTSKSLNKDEKFKEKPHDFSHIQAQTQEGQTGVWKWAGL